MSNEPVITKPFYIDHDSPGIVRGGFFDENGGLLVGRCAEWVCKALNDAAGFPNTEDRQE